MDEIKDEIQEVQVSSRKCGEIFFESGKFSYNCESCEINFEFLEDFQNHFFGIHHIKSENSDLDLDTKNISITEDDNKTGKRESRSGSFSSLERIYDENTAESEEEIKVLEIFKNEDDIEIAQDKKTLQIEINTNAKPKKRKSFPCPNCERVYQRPKLLKAHLETHTPGFLTCKICHKTLTTKQNLQIHMKIHSGEFAFECNVCPAKFSRNGNLVQHMKRHAGVKPFVCKYDNCSYRAIYPVHLKNHEATHTNERKEICEFCGQTFKEKGHLKEHIKRHNNQRDFACPTCDKRFFDRKTLTEHEHIHSGVKSFICSVCSVLFSSKRNLKAHMKKHSGVKSYICKFCSEAFYLYSERQYHLKSRHGGALC